MNLICLMLHQILHLYFASDNNVMINKTYKILEHIHNHWENTVDEKSHKKLRQILMEKILCYLPSCHCAVKSIFCNGSPINQPNFTLTVMQILYFTQTSLKTLGKLTEIYLVLIWRL